MALVAPLPVGAEDIGLRLSGCRFVPERYIEFAERYAWRAELRRQAKRL
jgi:hypothetical protein